MNPIEIIKQMFEKGNSPEQIILKMLNGGNSNPIIDNLINLAKKGDNQNIMNFARNIYKEKNGGDFDKDFSAFMKQING